MSKKNKEKYIDLEKEQSDNDQKILMRQIKEEARREKLEIFISKYKKQISYCVAILVLIIIAFGTSSSIKHSRNVKYSKLIHEALIFENLGKKEEFMAKLSQINDSKSAPVHIKSLSLLKYASELVSQNKISEAKEAYLKVNSLKNADPYIIELSGFLALKSMIDSGDLTFEKDIRDLTAKLSRKSLILKPLVTEQEGIFYILKGNFKKAKEIFDSLRIDVEASAEVKKRAEEFYKIVK